MPAFESIRQRIRSAGDLLTVVRTMKVLAAVNIRQYQRAVDSLASYCLTIEQGLQVALRDRLDPAAVAPVIAAPRCAAVVWGSDQGLCGQFNRQIAGHARAELAAAGFRPEQCRVLAVGGRAAEHCAELGLPVAQTHNLPATVAGITPLVGKLLIRLNDWHAARQVDRVFLFYHDYQSGLSSRPGTVRLLPVDAGWLRDLVQRSWPSRSLPVFAMDPERLLAALIHEHLFTRLYRATAESLASENAGRLAAMQRAEKNITEHGQELRRQFHRLRQAAITDELLDIVSGSEALQPAVAPAAG